LEPSRRYIGIFLEIFKKKSMLAKLGKGLVASLFFRFFSHVHEREAEAWINLWEEAAGDLEEMALPLRLLKAGVKFHLERDRKTLLFLPAEERSLIESKLFNIYSEQSGLVDEKLNALLSSAERFFQHDCRS
jgi:hypothetical protein